MERPDPAARRRGRRRPTASAATLAAALALAAAAGAGSPAVFRFERLNATYEGSAPEIAEIESGPITIRPSAPDFELRLHDHRLQLSPLPGAEHAMEVDLEFEGRSTVVAEISLGRFPARLEDDVVLPRQRHRVRGRVEVAPEEEGYRLVVRELPSHLTLEVESRLGGQLVELCDGFSLFLPGSNCSGLERALSRVQVRLPKPGADHLLRYEDLTDEERQMLDRYLNRSS